MATAALPPVHNRQALEHAIYQKGKELRRVQARAHALYEGWLRVLAHHEQQKQDLLARFQSRAAACEAAATACSAVRSAYVSVEQERLSGELDEAQSLAAEPEPGGAPAARRALARAQQLEEGIKQREAELAALPSKAAPHLVKP
jgi:hypothetical protein